MPRKPAKRKQTRLARLDAATREIVALKATIVRSFHDLGRRLAEVHDEKLHEERGHATFDDYLEREVAFSRASAFKFMLLARTFTAEVARDLGADRLYAALRYIKATPEDESPADIPRLVIPVEGAGGKPGKKPLREASVREIAAAARAVAKGKGNAGAGPGAAKAKKLIRRAMEALGRAHVNGIDVTVAPRRKDGATRLRVDGVPVEGAWQAFAILAHAAEGET